VQEEYKNIFLINNIAEYMFKLNSEEGDSMVNMLTAKIPIKPPFEWSLMKYYTDDFKFIWGQTVEISAIVSSKARWEEESIFDSQIVRDELKNHAINDLSISHLVNIYVNMYPVHNNKDRMEGQTMGFCNLFMDKEGYNVDSDQGHPFFHVVADHHFSKDILGGDTERNDVLAVYASPFIMALKFLHCKNVVLVDEPDAHKKRVYNMMTKDKRKKKDIFKVLEITQIKKVLKEEGEQDSKGFKHALHICRGHFRTYDETNKLFGKITGTFWISPHMRGDKNLGEVHKDYKPKIAKIEENLNKG